jgi:large subunit ribosomal protein L11
MAKKVAAVVKLQLEGATATPAPPVGPALGAHKVNLMQFCKAFNDKTSKDKGVIIPVEITVFEDGSFTFITKTPPASFLIKQALKLKSGSPEPNKVKVGQISEAQLEEIANKKMKDLNARDIEAAKNIIRGTARAMGVTWE